MRISDEVVLIPAPINGIRTDGISVTAAFQRFLQVRRSETVLKRYNLSVPDSIQDFIDRIADRTGFVFPVDLRDAAERLAASRARKPADTLGQGFCLLVSQKTRTLHGIHQDFQLPVLESAAADVESKFVVRVQDYVAAVFRQRRDITQHGFPLGFYAHQP